MRLTKDIALVGLRVKIRAESQSLYSGQIGYIAQLASTIVLVRLPKGEFYYNYDYLDIQTRECDYGEPKTGDKVIIKTKSCREGQIGVVRQGGSQYNIVDWPLKRGDSGVYLSGELLLVEEFMPENQVLSEENLKVGVQVRINPNGGHKDQGGGTEGRIDSVRPSPEADYVCTVKWGEDIGNNSYRLKDLLFVGNPEPAKEEARPIQNILSKISEGISIKALRAETYTEYSLTRIGSKVNVNNDKGIKIADFPIDSIDTYFMFDTRPKETYRMATDYPYRMDEVSLPADYLTAWTGTDKSNNTYDTINLRRNTSSIETTARRVGNPCKSSAGKSLVTTRH